jgi:hypothetical protein
MKDMYINFNSFIELCSRSIDNHSEEEGHNFIESMEASFDLLRTEPEYLKHAAAIDLLTNVDMEGLASVNMINSDTFNKIETHNGVTDKLINFIITEVKDGEAALLSALCKLRFGYVMEKISNPEGNEIVASLLRTSLQYSSSWFGLLAMRMATTQPDERIAKGIGYTASHIELLQEIKTKEWLTKQGGHNIKRHLVSNDLGM